MKPDLFDLEAGTVTFWDLHDLDEHAPIEDQIDSLKEDLAQVEYGALLLDIGWYPSFSADGSFLVQVIREQNWGEPVFKKECRTCAELIARVRDAVSAIGEDPKSQA